MKEGEGVGLDSPSSREGGNTCTYTIDTISVVSSTIL